MGSEMCIRDSPRGPVGLEGLVTYKYFLKGSGNTVDDFSSGKAIYTHKDL